MQLSRHEAVSKNPDMFKSAMEHMKSMPEEASFWKCLEVALNATMSAGNRQERKKMMAAAQAAGLACFDFFDESFRKGKK